MKDVLASIKSNASALNKTIVLPEGEDQRVVKAASLAVKENLAKVVVLGNEEEIKKANPDVDVSGVIIIDPVTNEKTSVYAEM